MPDKTKVYLSLAHFFSFSFSTTNNQPSNAVDAFDFDYSKHVLKQIKTCFQYQRIRYNANKNWTAKKRRLLIQLFVFVSMIKLKSLTRKDFIHFINRENARDEIKSTYTHTHIHIVCSERCIYSKEPQYNFYNLSDLIVSFQ